MYNELKTISGKYIPKTVLNQIVSFVRNFKIVVLKDKKQYEIREWYKNKGDEILRLEYDLSSESLVFDIGGFKGDFTEQIFNKYSCRIFLFEPVRSFYNTCYIRFQGNNKITCYNFGLSSHDGSFSISIEGSSSSTFKKSLLNENVKIVDISKFISENNINNIDLVKINIEGAEYEVLEKLIETDMVKKCKHLQIQFHDFVENAVEKRNSIRARLVLTHKESWCFPFVWESWVRKENI